MGPGGRKVLHTRHSYANASHSTWSSSSIPLSCLCLIPSYIASHARTLILLLHDSLYMVAHALALAATNHEHDQPPHLKLKDPGVPEYLNGPHYAAPESRYCPAGMRARSGVCCIVHVLPLKMRGALC
jgi:hypothetical protein